ncbi:MAG: hypothetical protein K5931_01600 [Lachnospiraceae bacterium]|nr:hypothetical protein [Lachnospiraceae bacterium]
MNKMRDRVNLKSGKGMRERKDCKYTILAGLMIIGLLTCFLTRLTYAKAGNPAGNEDQVKIYESRMIYLNDSLYSIARKNMTEGYGDLEELIKEIEAINNIDQSTVLIPGNSIIVPRYVSKAAKINIAID